MQDFLDMSSRDILTFCQSCSFSEGIMAAVVQQVSINVDAKHQSIHRRFLSVSLMSFVVYQQSL